VKYIRKMREPENFHRWKTRNKGANWNDFSGTSESFLLNTQKEAL